jgi:hypothetical protein
VDIKKETKQLRELGICKKFKSFVKGPPGSGLEWCMQVTEDLNFTDRWKFSTFIPYKSIYFMDTNIIMALVQFGFFFVNLYFAKRNYRLGNRNLSLFCAFASGTAFIAGLNCLLVYFSK